MSFSALALIFLDRAEPTVVPLRVQEKVDKSMHPPARAPRPKFNALPARRPVSFMHWGSSPGPVTTTQWLSLFAQSGKADKLFCSEFNTTSLTLLTTFNSGITPKVI